MATTYFLGSQVPLGVTITDANGNPADATTVVLTVTNPDGTSATPSVTHSGTGLYDADYVPTQAGRHTVFWVATGTNASSYADDFTIRDPNSISIVSMDEVKDHLNIPYTNTTNDTELYRFIDAATEMAQNYTGTILGRQTFTNEIYDGNQQTLRLLNPKAITILSVVENGLTLGSSDYA